MEKEVGGVTEEAIDNIRKVAELKTALHLRVLGRIDDKKTEGYCISELQKWRKILKVFREEQVIPKGERIPLA